MGIEPTPNLKTKRLPSAGGTVWNASEATGTISGRELDVSPDVSRNSTDYGGGVGHRRPELLKVAQHVVLSSQNLCFEALKTTTSDQAQIKVWDGSI